MYRAEDFRHLSVLIEHLPHDSATARARGHTGLSTSDRVLLDSFAVLVGERHPIDPARAVEAAAPTLQQKLLAQRERAQRMREAQDGG